MFHTIHSELQPTPQLVASSALFAIPLTCAAVRQNWINYACILNVLLSSTVYHATKHPFLYFFDQAAILLAMGRAISLMPWYPPLTHCSSLVFFGTCYMLDIYGRQHQVLMWNPCKKKQILYHILLHVAFTVHTSCVILTV